MRCRKRLVIFFSLILLLGFFLINFLRQIYVVPIIMYHSVRPKAAKENRLVVSVDLFERQMRFLKARRYNVVPLESLAMLIKDKKRIPPKTIAITFDDGYKDNYTYAFPILKKYNLVATIFVIVNEVGRFQGDRLNWHELRQMQDSGIFTVASHAMGPEPLINLKDEEEIRYQIFESKKILEQNLGRRPEAFSYPEGRFNNKIRQLVIDAGYSLAVVTNPGREFPNDDIFALKRLRISSTSDNLFVFWIETCGYYNFIREHRHK